MSLDHANHEDQRRRSRPSFWKSKAGLVAAGFLLIGLFFLLSEHRAHLFGVLPYLLILACPLMHLFMHRGHGGHHHQEQPRRPDTGEEP
ncbi:MAG: DUF2933 domain-containing protein [Rhodospirillaceae bacterium]|nr:DUF2933 domain-containing protein [Rhodospirillaceae bacterium]